MIDFSRPIFITNTKNYAESMGDNLVPLLLAHEKAMQTTHAQFGVAVSATEVSFAADMVHVPVLAQHFDDANEGSTTGAILPQKLAWFGAKGSLLNHSEQRIANMGLEAIENHIIKARQANLPVILCAESPEEVKQFANLAEKPDAIAYEPPDLIGSKTDSVASKPESIKDAVQFANGIPLLVGAGIKTPKDLEISLELGAKGFLVASGVVKSKDPARVLEEFGVVMQKFE